MGAWKAPGNKKKSAELSATIAIENAREDERTAEIEADLAILFYRFEQDNVGFADDEAARISKLFRELATIDRAKAREFFSSTSPLSDAYLADGWEFDNLVLDYDGLSSHPDLGPFLADVSKNCSGTTIRVFVEKTCAVGWDVAKEYLGSRKNDWNKGEAERLLILEQFFLDEKRLETLAKEAIVSGNVDATPAADGTIAVELSIPSIAYDPHWYEFKAPVYHRGDDEQDHTLPSTLKKHHNLDRAKEDDFRLLLSGLRSGDRHRVERAIERAAGHGPVPPEKLRDIVELVQFAANVWGISTGEKKPLTQEESVFQARLAEIHRTAGLPDSAKPLVVRHAVSGRERTIQPFFEALHQRMLETALSEAIDQARSGKTNRAALMEGMLQLENEAILKYDSVVNRGVPAFKDFATWILTEQEKAEHAGEFYVGRDTMGTLYPAAHAARWGKMSGAKRHKLTVFVNVSRPLAGATTREVMRKWLEQEQVTQGMMGIDGGYSGSSPEKVFQALNPKLTTEDLDRKVRLLEATSTVERRFNAGRAYDGIVSWMEMLPKFTDRAKKVEQNPLGKYYVVEGNRRSPAERVLAWTVQHAVWRELINHDPVAHPLPETDPNEAEPMIAPESVPPKYGGGWGSAVDTGADDTDTDTAQTPSYVKQGGWGGWSSKEKENPIIGQRKTELKDWAEANGFMDSFINNFDFDAKGFAKSKAGFGMSVLHLEDGNDDIESLPSWMIVREAASVNPRQKKLFAYINDNGGDARIVTPDGWWQGDAETDSVEDAEEVYVPDNTELDTPEQAAARAELRKWAAELGGDDRWIQSFFSIQPEGTVSMHESMHLDGHEVTWMPDVPHGAWSARMIYVAKDQDLLAADAQKKGYTVVYVESADESFDDWGSPDDDFDYNGGY